MLGSSTMALNNKRTSWGQQDDTLSIISSTSSSTSKNNRRSSKLWGKLRKQASRIHSNLANNEKDAVSAGRHQSMIPPSGRTSVSSPFFGSSKSRSSAEVTAYVAQHRSMDIPRATTEITAENIRRTLGGYTGKSEEPSRRFRKQPPQQQQQQQQPVHRAPTSSKHHTYDFGPINESKPSQGLECIAEDDEPEIPDMTPNRPAPPPPPSRSQSYKRFSENSESTTSSGETAVPSDELGGSFKPLPNTKIRSPLPRASLPSHSSPRPRAIYDTGQMTGVFTPSPTKEHPPHLVAPLTNGDTMQLDPDVYRNTFFNARPVTAQQHIEEHLLSNKQVRKSASEDTLKSSTPTRIRFSEPLVEVIPPADKRLNTSMPILTSLGSRRRKPSESTVDLLRCTVKSLQVRNDLLTELVKKDKELDVSESVGLRLRSLELENKWMRKELAKLGISYPLL